jgi:lipopolysaccharide export system protein LptC
MARRDGAGATAPTVGVGTTPVQSQTAQYMEDRPVRAGGSYSRFVHAMKLLLPSVAATLVLLVVIWPQLDLRSAGTRFLNLGIGPEDAENLQMVNARFLGTDEASRPYTLTAEMATHASADATLISLTKPRGDITLQDGAWLAINAARGRFNRETQILELEGGVNLFHDKGYEIRSPRARIDLDARTVASTTPVEGQGPFGLLTGEGFRILDEGKTIFLTGKSSLIIYPPEGSDKQ